MGFLVSLAVPLVLLSLLILMTSRLLLPGLAGSVFLGHVMRDVFWGVMRGLVALLALPFRLLRYLFSSFGGTPPPRRRGRKQRRFRRRR